MSSLSFKARPLDPRARSSSSNQKWRGKARTGGHVTTTARRRLQNANRNNENTHNQRGKLVIRNADLGGSYGDSFVDVDNLLVNYFTFKALKSSLAQMQETDLSPGKGEYKWLYNFASENYKNDGQKFIRALFAEGRQDHAERLIKQREDLLQRWIKRFAETGGLDCGLR